MDGEAFDRALESPLQKVYGNNGDSFVVPTRFIAPLIPVIRELGGGSR